jgi:uncharacterized protein
LVFGLQTADLQRVQAEPSATLRLSRLKAWLVFAGMLVALAYAFLLVDAPPEPRDLLFRYSTAISSIVLYGLLAVPFLLILRGLPRREVLGLSPPRDWHLALGLALATVVVDFVGVYLYDLIFGPFEEGTLAEFWDGSRATQFAVNFIAIAVLAPIFEELMFRGLGYGLLEPFGAGTAIVVTGVLFGLVHGYVYVLPVFIVYGLVLGWLRSRTGSIYPGMLAHGATNATVLILTVALA